MLGPDKIRGRAAVLGQTPLTNALEMQYEKK